MGTVKRQFICEKIVQFYENNANKSKKLTVDHFVAQGEKAKTVYSILQRYNTYGDISFRPKSGRPRTVSTTATMRKVKNKLVNKNSSEREVARKLGLKKSTVHDMKSQMGIKTRKCVLAPKYTNGQKRRAKKNCRKIYRNSIHKIFIIDETYVTADPANTNRQKFYNFININSVEDNTRFKPKEKFPKRFLVWQCIDEFGNVSKPYIKCGTLTGVEYRDQCLKKILLPFITKYHNKSDVLFWPDMASIHYEKSVLNWLQTNGINFVPKEDNAPNVPHARPIEQFWKLCKEEYSRTSKVKIFTRV
jgi:transposase